MKLKLLSIFFVVLIAQTQVVQGSPLEVGPGLGGLIETSKHVLTGAVNTISNTLQGVLSLLSNVLNGVAHAIQNAGTRAISDVNSVIAAVGQLGSSNGGATNEDPLAAASAYLINAAAQILSIINDLTVPLSRFDNSVSNLLENPTALLSNQISNINGAFGGLSSAINSVDIFQSAIEVTFQGAGLIGNVLDPVAVPIGTAIANIAATVPVALDTGLNELNADPLNINNILNAASIVINTLDAQIVTGAQSILATAVPITLALNNPVNNLAKVVSSVPAKINNAISAMNNAKTLYLDVSGVRRQEIRASIANIGTACAIQTATTINDEASAAEEDAVLCLSNEIPTLQNYLAEYQNYAAQYQAGITTNTLSIATLRQTIQTSVSFSLYLISVNFKVKGCFGKQLLGFSANLLPLAAYGVTCTDSKSP